MNLEPTTPAPSEKDQDFVRKWLAEIAAAGKRDKDWHKDAAEAIKLYESAKPDENQFNILYSNTETLIPALYNNIPRPVVRRRFKSDDPMGLMASKTVERTLEYLQDTGDEEYSNFDELMKPAVLAAVVPGRGVTWFKYESKVEPQAGVAPGPDGAQPERVTYETVCGEDVPWDRFRHGYARQWKRVPWVAREHDMTREELEENFGEAKARLVQMGDHPEDDEVEQRGLFAGMSQDPAKDKLARVWEIWDKTRRKVIFVAEGYKLGPLKEVDDPLRLQGFFPCPRPLTFYPRLSNLTPTTLMSAYKEQAKELNRITVRIQKLIAAMKVRGLYDASIEGIKKVMEAEDNTLVPAENAAVITSQGQKLENALWLVPIEKFIPVLQQLYVQREQCKQVIYEISGLSDILRGASVASETATAQNIKNQWGTLRLKKMQKEVMRYTRECLRIMAELAITNFSPDTLSQMTGLPYPTQQAKVQAQAAIQNAQIMARMTGQQPAPPSPEQAAAAAMPSWEEILGLLRDDNLRNYRVDIETNSTIDAEATEDKQDISELLNALAQFLSGVAPLVENQSLPFEAARAIMLAVVRRYRFGVEVEEELAKMKAPTPPPDPNAGKMEIEKAKMDGQLQLKQAELQMDRERHQMEMQIENLRLQLEQAKMQMEMQKMRYELEFMREKQGMELQGMQVKQQAQAQQAAIATDAAREGAAIATTAKRDQAAIAKDSAAAKAKAQKAAAQKSPGVTPE